MIKSKNICSQPESALEVLLTFLKLGLTSFGGPVAHIGYFRKALVEQRRWLSDEQFGQLLAICQFLPGPASSQLGFCIGLLRAGWLGAISAFLAFTLPSVLLLLAFVSLLPYLDATFAEALIHGLKLVACAIVADAVIGMTKNLCPDLPRKALAIASAVLILLVPVVSVQLIVIILAAVAGAFVLAKHAASDQQQMLAVPFGKALGSVFILIFMLLLLLLLLLASSQPDFLSVANAFYHAGALVFGGGHVVLPLLQEATVGSGWISQEQFLAGYGAAQAIPGPMFAFSAYLGALMPTQTNAIFMAFSALFFIFLPGFLLVLGVLPFWHAVSQNRLARGAIMGVNAAVVGLLGAALYNPIFIAAITKPQDLAIVLVALAFLRLWQLSPLVVVFWCVAATLFGYWL